MAKEAVASAQSIPLFTVFTSPLGFINGLSDTKKAWGVFLDDRNAKNFFSAMFKTCYTALQAFFTISACAVLVGGAALVVAAMAVAIPIAGLALSSFVLVTGLIGLVQGIINCNFHEIKKSLLFILIGAAGLVGFSFMIIGGPYSVGCLSGLIVFGVAWSVSHTLKLKEELAQSAAPPAIDEAASASA